MKMLISFGLQLEKDMISSNMTMEYDKSNYTIFGLQLASASRRSMVETACGMSEEYGGEGKRRMRRGWRRRCPSDVNARKTHPPLKASSSDVLSLRVCSVSTERWP
jgi:hypothetical protein